MTTTNADKEFFFTETLLPLGQLTEILVALVHRARAPAIGGTLAQPVFDLLNLVSVFALSPAVDVGQLKVLQTALRPLRFALITTFSNIQEKPPISLESRIARLRQQLPDLVAQIRTVAPAVYEALGYTPQTRSEWLAQHASYETVGGRPGRTKKWRTFVRHGNWDAALRHVPQGLKAEADKISRKLREHGLLSEKLAANLWTRTFYGTVTVAPLNVPTAGNPDELIPSGVFLTVLPSGHIEVFRSYDPLLAFNPVQRAELASAQLSKEVSVLFGPREYRATCDIAGFSTVIAAVRTWIAEQDNDIPQRKEVYAVLSRERQKEALKKRLLKAFSPAELRVLKEIMPSV